MDYGWSRRSRTALLKSRPQLADKCDKWDEMSGGNWASLLGKQPQFADRCDWSKLNVMELDWLLDAQPQLASRHGINH